MIGSRIYSKVEFLKFANSNGFKLLTRSFEPSIKLSIIIVNRIFYESWLDYEIAILKFLPLLFDSSKQFLSS